MHGRNVAKAMEKLFVDQLGLGPRGLLIFSDREPGWRCVVVDEPGSSGCSSKARSVCGLEPCSWEWIGGPESSTVAEWGLVCGEKYKVGLVQALFFGGCMVRMSSDPIALKIRPSFHFSCPMY